MKPPLPLPGANERERWLNRLLAFVVSLEPKGGPGVLFQRRPNGTTFRAEGSKGGSETPVSDWFRGDWDLLGSYEPGEGVVIRGGLTAGFYMCHTDAPAGSAAPSPADNTYWTLVVSGNGMGLWQ